MTQQDIDYLFNLAWRETPPGTIWKLQTALEAKGEKFSEPGSFQSRIANLMIQSVIDNQRDITQSF